MCLWHGWGGLCHGGVVHSERGESCEVDRRGTGHKIGQDRGHAPASGLASTVAPSGQVLERRRHSAIGPRRTGRATRDQLTPLGHELTVALTPIDASSKRWPPRSRNSVRHAQHGTRDTGHGTPTRGVPRIYRTPTSSPTTTTITKQHHRNQPRHAHKVRPPTPAVSRLGEGRIPPTSGIRRK